LAYLLEFFVYLLLLLFYFLRPEAFTIVKRLVWASDRYTRVIKVGNINNKTSLLTNCLPPSIDSWDEGWPK